ncbi:MAG: outer membrane protein transport protein [Gammaproteobacteria bacterium]|nr:outer membrane protein transport protein [Gammaproteobacteria bacterium]
MKKLWIVCVSVFGTILPSVGFATTGYFALGYGSKSMGMAGAVVAAPQDALVGAANPAGFSELGHRTDFGLRLFSPIREAELDPRVLGGSFLVDRRSSRESFFIPNFGYARPVNDKITVGVSIFGNGGLNTTYARNIYDETAAVLGAFQQGFQGALASGASPAQAQAAGAQAAGSVPEGTGTGLPNTGRLGVDLAQLIIAPTLSYKLSEQHSVGVAPLIGIQAFEATGLGNFQCFTQTANSTAASRQACATRGFPTVLSDKLTNNGKDWSAGLGVRVGWLGKVQPNLTLGASAASKIYMDEFDDYSELFAEDGGFDIPANVAIGASLQATPKLLIALDYQRIFYGDVDSISNTGPVASPQGPTIPPGSGLLGTDNGLGFGWEDINIVRLGLRYMHDSKWTFRGGVAYNESPIPDSELLFNILAPATPEWHVTAGFTYTPKPNMDINFAYMHAFDAEQSANVTAFGVPGAISMYQNSVEFSISFRL